MPVAKKLVTNPVFQSVIFGGILLLVFILIWQKPINRYNVEVEPYSSEFPAQTIRWFAGDFNYDGKNEFLSCGYGQGSNRLDITHFDENWQLTDQYHIFSSEWNFKFTPGIYDIDGDKKSELLFFNERNDSIFFNAFSLSQFYLSIDHHFFYEIERKRAEYSYLSEFYDFGDFDGDGNNELYFRIDAGFGLYPRGIFKIEFPSLLIESSDTEYMALSMMYSKDITNDGIPEIFTSCSTPSNTKQYKKYSDAISYITVLNRNLECLFEPIPIPGEFASVQSVPSCSEDSIFYTLYYSRSKNKNPLSLYVINSNGEILKSKHWNSIKNLGSKYVRLFIRNNQAYFFLSGNGVFKLDANLSKLPEKLALRVDEAKVPMQGLDITEDGIDEWISVKNNREMFIYNEASNSTVSFLSPIFIDHILRIFPIYKDSKIEKYMAETGAGFFFFRYSRNQYYYVLYLIYLAVFLISSFSVWLILYLQRKTIERKWDTEKQLSELQFNQVKNQLNPHFLFNALNSVAFMINEGKNDEAYDFLAVNSRMIQRVMNDAKEVKRPLKDEIQFTKDYLRIQKHRFKDRFEANFTIDENVDQLIEVPKMCIHTYVENAIKHGFRDTKSGGLLQVNIDPVLNGVAISISDNGMGRKAASEYKDSTGNGINIMNEFYRLFEKYHNYKIDFSIGKNKPVGTVVKLRIQV